MAIIKYAGTRQYMNVGFPTHTTDITGRVICLGDRVTYCFEGKQPEFEVVFEQNAFRKKYKKWEPGLSRPLIEYGYEAEKMRLKVIVKEEARYFGDRVQILSVNVGIAEVRFDNGDAASIPIVELQKL